jgi:hypothetical protein
MCLILVFFFCDLVALVFLLWKQTPFSIKSVTSFFDTRVYYTCLMYGSLVVVLMKCLSNLFKSAHQLGIRKFHTQLKSNLSLLNSNLSLLNSNLSQLNPDLTIVHYDTTASIPVGDVVVESKDRLPQVLVYSEVTLVLLCMIIIPLLPACGIVRIGTLLAERLLYMPSAGYCNCFLLIYICIYLFLTICFLFIYEICVLHHR